MIFQISSYFWRVLDSRYSKNTSNIVPGWYEIYIFGTYVFWAIAAVFGPIWAIPSHVWMIMDPSWGSWGRFVDFSNFELFWERLYTVVTPKTQNGQKMAKNSQK